MLRQKLASAQFEAGKWKNDHQEVMIKFKEAENLINEKCKQVEQLEDALAKATDGAVDLSPQQEAQV